MPPPEIKEEPSPAATGSGSKNNVIALPSNDKTKIEEKPSKVNSWEDNFFAINIDAWDKLCQHDDALFPAAAYLVMAAGSQADNQTTGWSRNAIEGRLHVGRPKADEYLKRLLAWGAVEILRGGTKPLYKITWPDVQKKDGLVWLPAALSEAKPSPLNLLLDKRDLPALRLLIKLYKAISLGRNAGIDPSILRRLYARDAERSNSDVAVFHPTEHVLFDKESSIAEDFADSKPRAFRRALATLFQLGLMEWVPHVVDVDDEHARLQWPYATTTGTAIEREIGSAGRAAALRMGFRPGGENEVLVPAVLGPKFSLLDIARPTRIAHTLAWAEWDQGADSACWIEEYKALGSAAPDDINSPGPTMDQRGQKPRFQTTLSVFK